MGEDDASDDGRVDEADDVENGDGTPADDEVPLPPELAGDDWQMSPDSDEEFQPDPRRVAYLRRIADDIRGESSESKQLSATLYRISDLYDPDEDTSPQEIYLNVRNIMRVKAKGGLRKDE